MLMLFSVGIYILMHVACRNFSKKVFNWRIFNRANIFDQSFDLQAEPKAS